MLASLQCCCTLIQLCGETDEFPALRIWLLSKKAAATMRRVPYHTKRERGRGRKSEDVLLSISDFLPRCSSFPCRCTQASWQHPSTMPVKAVPCRQRLLIVILPSEAVIFNCLQFVSSWSAPFIFQYNYVLIAEITGFCIYAFPSLMQRENGAEKNPRSEAADTTHIELHESV